MNNSSKKTLIALLIGIIIVGSLYFVLSKMQKKETQYAPYLKNYKVNEYIPTYISDEAMAKIYLNDYISTLYYSVEDAYNLLDSEYRTKKFGSLDSFKEYVKNLPNASYTLKRFYVKTIDGHTVFGVYDQDDNLFIFKTNGVMQYSVFLDDYTVEI